VIEIHRASETIPRIEQSYSAGAVCLGLVNTALAGGWGAAWFSGWPSHDRVFVESGLKLTADERVAGLVYLGTATIVPTDRPRPDIDALTTWQDQ